MLAELARLKYSIAIAGTHGKTTTTSMIATIVDRAGYDPTVVVGGLLNTIGSNARLGKGEYIVLEADESDGSFLLLSPTMAVVTNIEADHLDYYKDLAEIKEAFLQFVNKVPFYGAAVLCLDDPAVQSLIPRMKRRFVTYGTAAQADVSILEVAHAGLGSTFTVRFNGGNDPAVRVACPGDAQRAQCNRGICGNPRHGCRAVGRCSSPEGFSGCGSAFPGQESRWHHRGG
jgi:UDP-N-acetylmuramate--alanine ligase